MLGGDKLLRPLHDAGGDEEGATGDPRAGDCCHLSLHGRKIRGDLASQHRVLRQDAREERDTRGDPASRDHHPEVTPMEGYFSHAPPVAQPVCG